MTAMTAVQRIKCQWPTTTSGHRETTGISDRHRIRRTGQGLSGGIELRPKCCMRMRRTAAVAASKAQVDKANLEKRYIAKAKQSQKFENKVIKLQYVFVILKLPIVANWGRHTPSSLTSIHACWVGFVLMRQGFP